MSLFLCRIAREMWLRRMTRGPFKNRAIKSGSLDSRATRNGSSSSWKIGLGFSCNENHFLLFVTKKHMYHFSFSKICFYEISNYVIFSLCMKIWRFEIANWYFFLTRQRTLNHRFVRQVMGKVDFENKSFFQTFWEIKKKKKTFFTRSLKWDGSFWKM